MVNFSVTKLIIPVAGAGTRLWPITKFIPKEMILLAGKPVIYYLVSEAYQSGIREIIFVIHPSKRSMQKYFSDLSRRCILSEFPDLRLFFIETSERFGDGHAISLARKFIRKGEFFAVAMGDLLSPISQPFLKQLINIFINFKKPVISVEQAPKNHLDRYGVIKPKRILSGKLYEIADLIEKPKLNQAPSNLILTGKYILPEEIFNEIEELLKDRTLGSEVRLADALKIYSKKKELLALECQGRHFDTGNKFGLLKTEIIFAIEKLKLFFQI